MLPVGRRGDRVQRRLDHQHRRPNARELAAAREIRLIRQRVCEVRAVAAGVVAYPALERAELLRVEEPACRRAGQQPPVLQVERDLLLAVARLPEPLPHREDLRARAGQVRAAIHLERGRAEDRRRAQPLGRVEEQQLHEHAAE